MRTVCFVLQETVINTIYKSLESLDQENYVILNYSDSTLLTILDQIAQEKEEIKNIINICIISLRKTIN